MSETHSVTLAYTIRPAEAEDIPKLEWGGQYVHFRDIFRRTFEEHQRQKRLMLVADVQGFPAGQIFLQFTSGDTRFADGHARGYLYSLRVMAPLQKLGIGTKLVAAAEEALRTRRFKWAVIAAARDNPAARRLYERLGFQAFAEDAGRWEYLDHEGKLRRVAEPCWVMEKRL